MSSDEVLENLEDEAKRIEEDSLYSSKAHFNASDSWSSMHLWIGIPITVLAAIASTYAFNEKSFIAGNLSLIVIVLTALATFLNPSEKAVKHKSAGNEYYALKNRARVFVNIDLKTSTDIKRLTEILNNMSEQRSLLGRLSPSIPSRSYKKAHKGIIDGESAYKVDIEKS